MDKNYYLLESSNTLESDKEIIFLGDSFTWGQGLYLNNWSKNRPEIFDLFYRKCKENEIHLQFINQEKFINKDDLTIKNNLSFTNIVANSLNRKCFKRIENGGCISINKQILDFFCKFESTKRDNILIFQFTSLGREDFSQITDEELNKYFNKNNTKDKIITNILNDRLFEIYKSIDNLMNELENRFGWNCYYLDWLGDFSKFYNPKKFISIGENKSFFELATTLPIKIQYKDKVFIDYHVNEVGNKIIAKYILDKINLENS